LKVLAPGRKDPEINMSNSSVRELNKLLVRGGVLQPEYAKVQVACMLFGIPRTAMFALIRGDNPKVNSIHFRKPGAKKGVRLVQLSSLRAYIETFARSPKTAG
jgi:hypothetical protein